MLLVQVWSKITVFVEDTSVAKKKLVSRTTRYSGLLDVLDFQVSLGIRLFYMSFFFFFNLPITH